MSAGERPQRTGYGLSCASQLSTRVTDERCYRKKIAIRMMIGIGTPRNHRSSERIVHSPRTEIATKP